MVVVSIIAGTAVVSMSSTTGSRSTMAAKQLQRDMTFARQRAVATGARSWVACETGPQTWTVYVEDPGSPGRAAAEAAGPLTDPATEAEFIQALNTGQFIGVTMTSVSFDSEDWIGFDWLGRPLAKTTEVAPLSDGTVVFSGGQQITIDKNTGYITFTP